VAGWGLIKGYEDTIELQKLSLPIWGKQECASINVPHSPKFFTQRLKFGTFCAGFVNSNGTYFFVLAYYDRICQQSLQHHAMVTAAVL
jgi:hypothetical protein